MVFKMICAFAAMVVVTQWYGATDFSMSRVPRTINGSQWSCLDATAIFHLPLSRRKIGATKHAIEWRGIHDQSINLH
jgi:hypothetical protein